MRKVKKSIKKKMLPKKQSGGTTNSGKKLTTISKGKKGTTTVTEYEKQDVINNRKKNSVGTTRQKAIEATKGRSDAMSKKIYNTAMKSTADSIYVTKDVNPKVFDSNAKLMALKQTKKTIKLPSRKS